MRVVTAESLEWEADKRSAKAVIYSEKMSGELRIEMLEVAPGDFIPAHRHSRRREFFAVTFSAGAQMQIGERIFRPIAGQVFEREPGEVLAVTNDTKHPLRLMITRIGFDESDVEWLESDPEEN